MAEMTSRERVLATLNHREPDRVPLDIGGGSSTSIVEEGYEKLKGYLNVSAESRLMNKTFRLSWLDEEVMQKLGSDCRPLTARAPSRWTPPPSAPGEFKDIWGITWRKVSYGENCYYWEIKECPLAKATVEDLERFPWPDPSDPGLTVGLAEDVKALHEETDYAIMADCGFKGFWEVAYFMRGFEQMLLDLVENPEFVSAVMAKLLEINIAATGRFLDVAGPYIHVFRTGDDLATQQGPVMSPATYRELLKPVYKEYFDFVKSKTEAKVFYHSCGNVTDLVDDLVEIGVEVLNPVQVSAMGDTAVLKDRFGEKVVFWGAIDTQRVLPRGSVEDVEAEVRRRIHDLGPGGGYVLGSVHNIQPDVPPENIIAMAEATRKYGKYPLNA
jgi:uroporphyrinogen decarboxylase